MYQLFSQIHTMFGSEYPNVKRQVIVTKNKPIFMWSSLRAIVTGIPTPRFRDVIPYDVYLMREAFRGVCYTMLDLKFAYEKMMVSALENAKLSFADLSHSLKPVTF